MGYTVNFLPFSEYNKGFMHIEAFSILTTFPHISGDEECQNVVTTPRIKEYTHTNVGPGWLRELEAAHFESKGQNHQFPFVYLSMSHRRYTDKWSWASIEYFASKNLKEFPEPFSDTSDTYIMYQKNMRRSWGMHLSLCSKRKYLTQKKIVERIFAYYFS